MKQFYDSLVLKKPCNKVLGFMANYYGPNSKRDNKPKEPLVFEKSLNSITYAPKYLRLRSSAKINHEVELGVIIGKKASKINQKSALSHIGGYFLLFDLTNSVIEQHRKEGRPVTLSKSGDGFLVVSEYIPIDSIKNPHDVDLTLKVNNEIKQSGNTKDLIFNINEQISYLSNFFDLNVGDLILTGTPAGIATFESGSFLEGKLNVDGKTLAELKVKIDYDLFESAKF